MSLPSARNPCTPEAVVFAPTERALAPADTAAVTLPATISPLKSETTIVSASDWVVAAEPGTAKTVARERPTLTTEPSDGYWKDSTSALVEFGHSRSPSAIVSRPGMVMRTRKAFAPVVALRGGGAADAIAVAPTTVTTTAMMKRITANQGSAGAFATSSRRAVPP